MQRPLELSRLPDDARLQSLRILIFIFVWLVFRLTYLALYLRSHVRSFRLLSPVWR